MAAPKKEAHSLTPVGCGFGAYCSSAGLIPVTVVAIVLAVVLTTVWIVGQRWIHRRRRGSSRRG